MKRTLMIAASLTLLGSLGACAMPEETDSDGDGVSSMTNEEYAKHVKINSCKADDFGTITAKLTINNKSDDQLSYMITAEAVLKNGERLTELNAASNNVRAGQKARAEAIGMAEGAAGKKFTCKVVNVETL